MKRNDKFYFVFGLSILILVVMSACNEFKAPPTMWDPNKTLPTGAVTIGVLPASPAIAGVREIALIGKFSSNLASNWVYFGSEQAAIKRVSTAADTLIVYRPVASGTADIRVIIVEADSIAHFPSYTLEDAIPASLSAISAISGNYIVIEADKGDTLWITSTSSTLGGYIYKLFPDGVTLTLFKDTSYFKAKINKKATDFVKNFSDLKFGPNGFLYATFNTTASNVIYQLNPDSATPVVYTNSTINNSISKFDFNSNGDIYTGYKNGLFLAKQRSAPVAVGDYTTTPFVEIRVFNGYVYAATSTSLFRSLINPDGTVGNKETVVDITNDPSISKCTISSINFSSDGRVFLSVLKNTTYSLYILENGSLSPYYLTNILPTGIDQLIWGGNKYLYLSKGKTGTAAATRLYKMGMAKNDNTPLYGAPYLGRNL